MENQSLCNYYKNKNKSVGNKCQALTKQKHFMVDLTAIWVYNYLWNHKWMVKTWMRLKKINSSMVTYEKVRIVVN